MRSDRPYATISEGISLQPAMRKHIRQKQNELRAKLPRFRDKQLKPLLGNRSQQIVGEISEEFACQLFDKQLKPMLVEFREHGGCIGSLKASLQNAVSSFEPRARQLMDSHLSRMRPGLPFDVKTACDRWFESHGAAPPDAHVDTRPIQADVIRAPNLEVPDFYGQIIDLTRVFAQGFVCYTAPLLASKPAAMIAGMAVGGTAVVLGAERAKEIAESWQIPGVVLKAAITDGRIVKMRESVIAETESLLRPEFQKTSDEYGQCLKDIVEREIDAMSEVNHLM